MNHRHGVLALVFIMLVGIFTSEAPANEELGTRLDGKETHEFLMPFDVEAKAAFLYEPEAGTILYAKNPDHPLPPASITKVMTLLLAFEALDTGVASWDDMIIVSENAWRMGGAQMFLEIGQEVSFRDLLTGISVISANDACIAMAEHLKGSESFFVQRMNERAAKLGMSNTRFQNSTGLPADDHYMSARDIAILAREIVLNHPGLLEMEAMREFTFNGIRQFNRNPLLGRYPGADGLKTGWTKEAGYSLVGTAKQKEFRLISVVLDTPSAKVRSDVSRQLMDYGFRNFVMREVVSPGDILGTIPVSRGKEKTVPVTVERPLKCMIASGRVDRVNVTYGVNKNLQAPAPRGERVGTVKVLIDNDIVARGELVTLAEVERAGFFSRLFRAIGDFFKSIIATIFRSSN
ncbi:MAG: D-alanyl-D-alanine carboxypeptidase [Deltaproteobacteria bacterium]|nr:D-alanyl-D-alanine carboxypeptidase [Deltaproteobacteria bacterium]